MSEQEILITQTVILLCSGLLLPLVLVVINRFTKKDMALKSAAADKLVEVNKKLEAHLDECNKIPKILIIEKIENLCEKIETNNVETREFRKEVKEELGFQRKRYHDLNNTISSWMNATVKQRGEN